MEVISPSGLAYVASGPESGAGVQAAINKAQTGQEVSAVNPVDALREDYAKGEESRRRPLSERLDERSKELAEKRKNKASGLVNFFKGIGRAISRADAAVDMASENVRDPRWRAEQIDKMDQAVDRAGESLKNKYEGVKTEFNNGVDDVCHRAQEGLTNLFNRTKESAIKAGKDLVNDFSKDVIAPVLTEIVAPVIDMVDQVDEIVSLTEAKIMEERGKSKERSGRKMFDAIMGSDLAHMINAAADRMVDRNREKSFWGKLFVGIDNKVGEALVDLDKRITEGESLRKGARDLRREFGARHAENVAQINSIDSEAARIKKQGLI